MIFFKRSLITISIVVIAISDVQAKKPTLKQKQKSCEKILTEYCGFKNDNSDYISVSFNDYQNSEDLIDHQKSEALMEYLESIFRSLDLPIDTIPITQPEINRVIVNIANRYIEYIIDDIFTWTVEDEFRETFIMYQGFGNKKQRLAVALYDFYGKHKNPAIYAHFQDFQAITPSTSDNAVNSDILQYTTQVQSFLNQNISYLDLFNRPLPGNPQGTGGEYKYLMEFPIKFYCRSVMGRDNDNSFFTNLLILDE